LKKKKGKKKSKNSGKMLQINTGKRTFDFDPKSKELDLSCISHPQNNLLFLDKEISDEEAVAIGKFLQENNSSIQLQTLNLRGNLYFPLTFG
jgi:hypothetical protein